MEKAPVQTFQGKEYHLYPGEKYFSRGKNKLHRVVWEYYNGAIPKGFQVHHKDHNPYNNDISNLELLTEEEHIRKHTMEIKQSETRIIMRSTINLNPLNPKRHTEDAINLQKKNLKKVGFLGGVVWNETTGNLIDGHRRVYAMDAIMKYDGTKETDYEVKVEVVNFDEKTEKEQMTYMAVGDTKADLDLIARYIGDVDYMDLGLDNSTIDELLSISGISQQSEEVEEIPDLMSDVIADAEEAVEQYKEEAAEVSTPFGGSAVAPRPAMTQAEKTAHVKEVKKQQSEMAMNRQKDEESYIVLSFSNHEAYSNFCDLTNIPEGEKFIKGESILELLQ